VGGTVLCVLDVAGTGAVAHLALASVTEVTFLIHGSIYECMPIHDTPEGMHCGGV
jgi:hypothetical protein